MFKTLTYSTKKGKFTSCGKNLYFSYNKQKIIQKSKENTKNLNRNLRFMSRLVKLLYLFQNQRMFERFR